MRINANKITINSFLTLTKVSTVQRDQLDKLPSQDTDNIMMLKWIEFVDICNFLDFNSCIQFVAEIEKQKPVHVSRWKLAKFYPKWRVYEREFRKVLNALEKINGEIRTREKTAKSMDEFGLTNITDFMAKAKNVPDEVVENWIVAKLLVEYKREVYHSINIESKFKTKEK